MVEPFRPDAKVYAMIDDLSRRSLATLLGDPTYARLRSQTSPSMRLYVKAYYEAGKIDADAIVIAWEDDNSLT